MGETATLTSQATLSIHPHTEDDGFGSRSSISLRITSRTGCQAAEVSCRVTYVAHDEKKTHAIRSLDAVSLAIIEQLQEDGRRPYAAIGKAVGLSEAAVRRMTRYSLRDAFAQFWERHLQAARTADGPDAPAPGPAAVAAAKSSF